MKLKTRLFIGLVTIGVILTVMGARDWMCLSKPVKDITDLWDYDYSNLKAGDHICLDVTLVWDQIGSHIEQHKTYGVTTSERETGRYYLIPFCQEEDEDFIYPTPFLLASIPSRYNDAMDSQIKKFDTWWETDEDFDTVPTSSMHFDGKLVKIPNDMRKQIEENFLDPGERLEDYMLPVMFEPIINPGAAKGTTIAGIICLLISGVIVFVMFKGKSGNQNGLYGMPNAQKTGFIPNSANTTGARFGGQPAQSGGMNNVDPYASGQPQNMQGGFGAPMGGQQPQNAQGSFGAPMGGQQPQNMQGGFGAPIGGQQPQNMQGGFGAPMGGQPQNVQGSFGAPMSGQQLQNTVAQSAGMAIGGLAAATQAPQPLGPSQPLGSQPMGAPVSSGSFPSVGTGTQAPAQEPASIFGNAPAEQPSIFGTKPVEQTSIFGNTPQEQSSIFDNKPIEQTSNFGNAPAEQPSIFGTKPAEQTSIFGNKPEEPASIFGNTPAQVTTAPIGNVQTQEQGSIDADGTVRNIFGEVDVEATEKARKEKEEAEKARKEEEARAELLKAMAYASSHPAILPMGGGAAAVQQSSQAATLPLGGTPTQVSSGPAATPAAQTETAENNAPVQQPEASPVNTGNAVTQQNNNPIFGNTSAQQPAPSPISGNSAATQQNNNPLYGNTPAQQPAPSPVSGNSAATQQNNNPLYGNTPAQQPAPSPVGGNNAATQQNNNPLYGSAPAPQAANPASSGEANENAPLYADNTEMKKVFSGAFGNNNNIG